jgi:tetratricopeptide (TPR) repeat protein
MRSDRLLAACLALALAAPAALAEPLIGAGVGNADTFASEASKLFNRKQYAKSAELFLKATRANPGTVTTYVQLARALMLAKEPVRACYAYRVYLRAVPDSPDRKKAAAESDQCERLVAGATKSQNDQLQKYVDDRAAFFASLDKNELMGPTGAAESFRTLVKEGFLGLELGDMGLKLGSAALSEADGIHKRALAGEKLTPDQLREARPLYQVAQDVGQTSVDSRGRMAYLDGLAELAEKNFKKAETHFTEAARSDPGNREYVFSRGVALFLGGERAEALKVLEAGLKDDPRTEVLRATQAINRAPEAGATELERILFSSRFVPEK